MPRCAIFETNGTNGTIIQQSNIVNPQKSLENRNILVATF